MNRSWSTSAATLLAANPKVVADVQKREPEGGRRPHRPSQETATRTPTLGACGQFASSLIAESIVVLRQDLLDEQELLKWAISLRRSATSHPVEPVTAVKSPKWSNGGDHAHDRLWCRRALRRADEGRALLARARRDGCRSCRTRSHRKTSAVAARLLEDGPLPIGPTETVHLAVVDPGCRDPIGRSWRSTPIGQRFIGPDNGLLRVARQDESTHVVDTRPEGRIPTSGRLGTRSTAAT